MEDLKNRFTYHAPQAETINKFTLLRDLGFNYAKHIERLCPDCRERSLAITKLEEVVMWANASIARHDK